MYHKSNVPSIFKISYAWIPLVSKEVSNRELQVNLMGSSLFFLIFWWPKFSNMVAEMAHYSMRCPIFLTGWILVLFDGYSSVLPP